MTYYEREEGDRTMIKPNVVYLFNYYNIIV